MILTEDEISEMNNIQSDLILNKLRGLAFKLRNKIVIKIMDISNLLADLSDIFDPRDF